LLSKAIDILYAESLKRAPDVIQIELEPKLLDRIRELLIVRHSTEVGTNPLYPYLARSEMDAKKYPNLHKRNLKFLVRTKVFCSGHEKVFAGSAREVKLLVVFQDINLRTNRGPSIGYVINGTLE